MHGVGQRYAENAFKAFSLRPFITVNEQVFDHSLLRSICNYKTKSIVCISSYFHLCIFITKSIINVSDTVTTPISTIIPV